MEHRIRYGALSTASILPRFVGGMNETENGCVEAIASRTLEKAQRTAQELGIPKAYGDYHELLQDPELDAVYIPVMNSLHYSYAYDALKAGKHVVMEKPFVLHTWQAEELQELAVSNSLFLTEAIKTPFLPVYAAVKHYLEQHPSNRIRYMEFKQSYTGGSYISGWNKEKESGGGVLYGNEAYFFRMAEFFGGLVEECYGTASVGQSGVEDQISLSVRLQDGILAALQVSTEVLFDNGLTIYLDEGRIVIPDYWKATHAFVIEEGTVIQEFHFPHDFELCYELSHYNDCIQNGLTGSPVNPLSSTIRYIGYCETLYQSWDKK